MRKLSEKDKKVPGPGTYYNFGKSFSHVGGAIGVEGKK